MRHSLDKSTFRGGAAKLPYGRRLSEEEAVFPNEDHAAGVGSKVVSHLTPREFFSDFLRRPVLQELDRDLEVPDVRMIRHCVERRPRSTRRFVVNQVDPRIWELGLKIGTNWITRIAHVAPDFVSAQLGPRTPGVKVGAYLAFRTASR